MKGTCKNNTCICDEGWSQSFELAFFNEDDLITSGTCGHNEQIIFWFHLTNLTIWCFILLQVFLLSIGSIGKLKRAVPTLTLVLLSITASARRISDPNAFLADDLVYSFFFANAFACMHILLVIFFDRYLAYLSERLNFGDVRYTRDRVVFVRKLNLILIVVDMVTSQLLWIATLTDRSAALLLIRFAVIVFTCRNIYNTSLYVFVFTSTIRDLQLLVKAKNCMQAGASDKLGEWLNRKIPQMIKMRRDSVLMASVALLLIYLPAVFTDFGIENLKYTLIIIPIIFAVIMISSMRLAAIKVKSDSSDMLNGRISAGTAVSASSSNRNLHTLKSAGHDSSVDITNTSAML